MPHPFRKKLTTNDVLRLQRELPSDDVIARQQGVRVYHGNIQEIEERMFPWLKRRRRCQNN